MEKYHLIVIGLDEIVSNKYYSQIVKGIEEGAIASYSVIDLKKGRTEVKRRLDRLKIRPIAEYYLNDPMERGLPSDPEEFGPVIQEIQKKFGRVRVYIAAELKAHEGYLRYCAKNGIDSLVEKPIIAPFVNNTYDPTQITKFMNQINSEVQVHGTQQSVMTLSRYHRIYNTLVIDELRKRVIQYEAPVTSFHFRHAGGVWNTHEEYNSREDHPYKYGYGMIMHGGYHYIDLSAQFLNLNKLIYPDDEFSLSISSYSAFPKDQNDRISKKYSTLFDDNRPEWRDQNKGLFGETDITSSFALRNETANRTITVGTLSFEQTTPSIRTWKVIPEDLYNKNGRISSVEVEAQLSTLFAVNTFVYDVPIREDANVDRIDAFARITTRANASLLTDEDFVTVREYEGLFHSDSNRDLMYNWLLCREEKSKFASHLPTMRLMQALSESVYSPGESIVIRNF